MPAYLARVRKPQRIFRRKLSCSVEIRQYAKAPPGRAIGDHGVAVVEQRGIATEFVDDEASDHRGILGIDHRLDADELGDHAAAVDVADDDDGNVGAPRKTHVGDVVLAQIDFGGTAGAFDQNEIGLRLQPRETFEHRRHQLRLHRGVVARAQGRDTFSLHDHLRADIGFRLQQNRIHVGVRLDAGGQRLQRLGAADLAAVDRHRRIVRHVLRLERAHAKTPSRPGAREPRDDERLAHVRARSLNHQCARHAI